VIKTEFANRAARRPLRLGIDVPLLLIVITLMIFGLLMLYSASWDYSYLQYGSPTYLFNRQLIWLGLGVGVAILSTLITYRVWRPLALPLMIVTIGGLLYVLIRSEVLLGAVRTVAGGSIQPSEMAKIMTVIYLAVWLDSKRALLNDITFGLIPLAAILGVIGGLIYSQPDLSATATVLILGGVLFFLAGADIRQILLMLLIAVVLGWVVVQLKLSNSARVISYIPGLQDPTQAHPHIQRSYEAFISGGWIGVGIGKATTKLTGLPFPPTDSIFAVVGEETGVLGSALLVTLYGLMLWRGLVIARKAPDQLGALLSAGLSIWIVLEAFLNMAGMLGLIPLAGNALPFVSYGGSNLMVTLTAVGIQLNIARISAKMDDQEEQPYRAFVDLRRRNRRRRVSRLGRAADPEE